MSRKRFFDAVAELHAAIAELKPDNRPAVYVTVEGKRQIVFLDKTPGGDLMVLDSARAQMFACGMPRLVEATPAERDLVEATNLANALLCEIQQPGAVTSENLPALKAAVSALAKTNACRKNKAQAELLAKAREIAERDPLGVVRAANVNQESPVMSSGRR